MPSCDFCNLFGIEDLYNENETEEQEKEDPFDFSKMVSGVIIS
jgi:hypothetical protein